MSASPNPPPLPSPLSPDALGKIARESWEYPGQPNMFIPWDKFDSEQRAPWMACAAAVARAVLASLAVGALPELHSKHDSIIRTANAALKIFVRILPDEPTDDLIQNGAETLIACNARRLAGEARLAVAEAQLAEKDFLLTARTELLEQCEVSFEAATKRADAAESEVARLAGELKELKSTKGNAP